MPLSVYDSAFDNICYEVVACEALEGVKDSRGSDGGECQLEFSGTSLNSKFDNGPPCSDLCDSFVA